MYVASYVSYVPTISSTKTNLQNSKEDSIASKKPLFNVDTKQSNANSPERKQTQQTSYLSRYNIFQKQEESQKDLQTFGKIKNYNDAKVAYTESSQMFSLARKPKLAIGKNSSIDLNLPKEVQEVKNTLSKRKMVNTYIENDNYYKITAAA